MTITLAKYRWQLRARTRVANAVLALRENPRNVRYADLAEVREHCSS